MSRILFVEDDLSLIEGLKFTLIKNGFEVDNARTVREAFGLYHQNPYDLLLLDVTLPDGTGFEICSEVRKSSMVPIIFLTASDGEVSTVMGLDMGGDDYITKPFKLNELVSRIRALLRRTEYFSRTDTIIELNCIKIDLIERKVWKNGNPVELTLAEYKLLCLFMKNPNRTLSREMILEQLWDSNGDYVGDSTLSVYIRRLRSKIEDIPNEPKWLLTERGFGYRWNVE